jgi:hypothetical protein
MSASRVQLGGIDLAACHFTWPKYRGITPQPVVFEQPAGLYESFASLARSLAGGTTTLRFEGPAGPGTQPGSETWEIDGVYIGEVSLIDSTRCRVVCYDRRYELRRRVFDKFYRVRFGDGYLEGTEKDTVESVFRDFAASIDLIDQNLNPDAFTDIRTSVEVPEGVMTQGLPALIGIGEIEELLQTDLTVDAGSYSFTGRADVDETALPDRGDYSWFMEPGWITEDNVKLQRPREIVVYSRERHCLAIKGYDDETTSAEIPGLDKEIRVELEQVYIEGGDVYTLDELLDAFGYSAGDMTDRTIAKSYMSNSFHGTAIEEDGTEDNRRVREAIKDGWRTLWRLKFPEETGHLGGWTNFAFGKINADGSAKEVAVDCPWVEFFEVLELDGNQTSTIGAALAANNEQPSPFRPVWEMGPEAGIIRLLVDRSKLRDKQNYAIPGTLDAIPRVSVQDNVKDGEGTEDLTEFYKIVEAEDFSKLTFGTSFEATVYICATRRMPNNERRWHAETVEGYKDGDVKDQELPPAEALTVRDYVSTDEEGHEPQADGLGPILNQDEVTRDAKRRAEAWRIAFGQQAAGEGVAESIMLARDTKVTGAIKSVSVQGTVEGETGVQVLRSRIEVGNLNDHAAIMRRATKRIGVKGGVAERGVERK